MAVSINSAAEHTYPGGSGPQPVNIRNDANAPLTILLQKAHECFKSLAWQL